MEIILQTETKKHKWNRKFLNEFADFYISQINPVKYQLNLIELMLCINRNNLGVPKELWNIICKYIKQDILNFKQKQCHSFYCCEGKTCVTIFGENQNVVQMMDQK